MRWLDLRYDSEDGEKFMDSEGLPRRQNLDDMITRYEKLEAGEIISDTQVSRF